MWNSSALRRWHGATLIFALLASPTLAATPVTPAPVVAAERAFAADGLELGIQGSFLKHSAPEGIVLNPEPVLARAVYGTPAPKGAPLVWWPLWAGIARSGDLGFTTGPYTFDGKPRAYYFTVWARQPDGGWKWLMDAGPPSDVDFGHLADVSSAESLPRSLDRALDALEHDEALHSAFGPGLLDGVVNLKRGEWAAFSASVTDWEHRTYTDLF